MNKIMKSAFVSAALLASVAAVAQVATPPFQGTVFIDPDVIKDTDPSAFSGLKIRGEAIRRNFDRRTNQFSSKTVRLFEALYDDGPSLEVQVNIEFGAVEAYNAATTYARSVGLLPRGIRRKIREIVVHKGDFPWGGGLTDTLVHTGLLNEQYITGGFMEEVFLHEAAHTTLDTDELVITPAWVAAQRSDPTFISTYARDNPLREDVAESFGAWYAVRFRPDRISPETKRLIEQAIPARLAVFDSLNLDPGRAHTDAIETDNYWITGLGPIIQRRLTIPDAIFSTGASFGANFNPTEVKRSQWGSVTVEFIACNRARLSWVGKDARFGSGGYDLIRLAPNEQQRLCERDPNADVTTWASGTWYGGSERSGEGIFIDVLNGGQAFVAWFTYGPKRPE